MPRYYRHHDATASRLVLGEMVIVRLPDGEMTVLGESASLLWAAVDGTRDLAALAALLQQAYGLPSPPDIGAFLGELEEQGLLRTLPAPAPDPRDRLPAPAPSAYAPPAVRVRERLETLAGTCPSAFDNQPATGDCRTDYISCDVVTGAG